MGTSPSTPDFRCDRCGQCCQTHRVPITRQDVLRLSAAGHRPEAFIELLGPRELDLEGEPETLALLPGGPRMPVLAHGALGCVFLERTGTDLTCSVHEARPFACRTYPFDRADDAPGKLGLHPEALCPTSTGLLQVVEEPPAEAHLRQVEARDRDLYQHAEFIGRWNRAQRMRRALGKTRRNAEAFVLALCQTEEKPPGKPGS